MHAVASLFYFPAIKKPIKTYIYVRKKRSFTSYPAAKHLKYSKFAITDIREKLVNFFYCSTRASTLVSATILLTQVPLQKFPFLFIIIILCLDTLFREDNSECLTIHFATAEKLFLPINVKFVCLFDSNCVTSVNTLLSQKCVDFQLLVLFIKVDYLY